MSNLSGRHGVAGYGFWLGTRRNRIAVVLGVFLLVALVVLALRGLDVALELLAFLGGMLLGGILAYLTAYPLALMTSSFSRLGRTVTGRILGISLAVGLMLLITHFTGVSLFLDESEAIGSLVFGLAFGSAMGIFRRFSSLPVRASEREWER